MADRPPAGDRRTVTASDLDQDFAARVLAHPDARALDACLRCGSCSAGCPIHEVFPEYNPKSIAKMTMMGMKNEVLGAPYIWYCATCRTCEQRCPQRVRFYNVLNVLKNIAAEEGYAPRAWVEQARQVTETGTVFPIEDGLVRKRRELSLRPLADSSPRLRKMIGSSGIGTIKPRIGPP